MGALTKIELQKIKMGLAAQKSVNEIAETLGRKPEVVARAIARMKKSDNKAALKTGKPLKTESEEDKILAELHVSPTYRELKTQFTPDELRYYEQNYCDIIIHLGSSDTNKAERIQIHKAVEYMVFMGRNKHEQLETIKDMERTKKELEKLEYKYPDIENRDERIYAIFCSCRDRLNSLGKRRIELANEYTALETKNQKLFEDLKATRNQRLSSADRRISITDLVAELMESDKREAVGRKAEMLKQFTKKHETDLKNPIKYADGSIDAPLLTPEGLEEVEAQNGEDA